MASADNRSASDVTVVPQAPAVFPYEALPVEEAAELQQLAERIRKLGRKQTGTIIEIGTKLLAAQARLHGQFISWVTAEFDMTYRGALPICALQSGRPTNLK